MPVIAFLGANLLVLLGALSVVRCLRWRGVVHAGLVAATWYFSQVVFSILFAGVVLQRLASGPVLLTNAVLTLALLAIGQRFGRRLERKWLAQGWREFVIHVREVCRVWWVAVLGGLALAEMLWTAFLGYIFPVYGYDSVAYHLVGVATWLQSGTFSVEPFETWSNVYPQDVEAYFTWLIVFLHNDVLANMGQLVFALGGTLAVIGIARLCGLGRPAAVGAGSLFFLTPILLEQVTTNYVDVAFASLFLISFYFVLRYLREPAFAHLLCFGLAAGLALGSKSSAVSFIAVECVVLVGAALYHRKLTPAYLAKGVALLAFPMLLLGLFWYVRAWVLYGNPIYPFTVSLLHHTIFQGRGSVADIILGGNTPNLVKGKPFFEQVISSWTNDPPHKLVSGAPYVYTYDQHLGGFGPQWLLLEFPALLAYGLYTLRKQRDVFFAFLLPFAVVFLVQPAMWWTRYVLFIVAPGAIALAFFLQWLKPRPLRLALQLATIVLVLVGLYITTFEGMYAPSNVAAAMRAHSTNATATYWFGDYQWVNHVPAGAHIGWVNTPDHWAIYPLFGATLANRVYPVGSATEAGFFAQLKADGITYLFAEKGTPYARWADADPQEFHLVAGTNRVYQVTLTALQTPTIPNAR